MYNHQINKHVGLQVQLQNIRNKRNRFHLVVGKTHCQCLELNFKFIFKHDTIIDTDVTKHLHYTTVQSECFGYFRVFTFASIAVLKDLVSSPCSPFVSSIISDLLPMAMASFIIVILFSLVIDSYSIIISFNFSYL